MIRPAISKVDLGKITRTKPLNPALFNLTPSKNPSGISYSTMHLWGLKLKYHNSIKASICLSTYCSFDNTVLWRLSFFIVGSSTQSKKKSSLCLCTTTCGLSKNQSWCHWSISRWVHTYFMLSDLINPRRPSSLSTKNCMAIRTGPPIQHSRNMLTT